MNDIKFDRVVEEQHKNRTNILFNKAKEYAADNDRLHNFKVAAALQGLTPLQALGGMMAKHSVSVYDMLWSGKEYPLELWKEKITDSQNYLDLALALVIEGMEKTDCHKVEASCNDDVQRIIEKHKILTCDHDWVVAAAECDNNTLVLRCKKCGKKTLRQNEVARNV